MYICAIWLYNYVSDVGKSKNFFVYFAGTTALSSCVIYYFIQIYVYMLLLLLTFCMNLYDRLYGDRIKAFIDWDWEKMMMWRWNLCTKWYFL